MSDFRDMEEMSEGAEDVVDMERIIVDDDGEVDDEAGSPKIADYGFAPPLSTPPRELRVGKAKNRKRPRTNDATDELLMMPDSEDEGEVDDLERDDGMVRGQADAEEEERAALRDLEDSDVDDDGNLMDFLDDGSVSDGSSTQEPETHSPPTKKKRLGRPPGSKNKKLGRPRIGSDDEDEFEVAGLFRKKPMNKDDELLQMPGGKGKGKEKVQLPPPKPVSAPNVGLVVRYDDEAGRVLVEDMEESSDDENVRVPDGQGQAVNVQHSNPAAMMQLVLRIPANFFQYNEVMLSNMMRDTEKDAMFVLSFMLFYLLSADFESIAKRQMQRGERKRVDAKIKALTEKVHACAKTIYALKNTETTYKAEKRSREHDDSYRALIQSKEKAENDKRFHESEIARLKNTREDVEDGMRGRFKFRSEAGNQVEFDRAQMTLEQLVNTAGSTVGGGIVAEIFDPELDIDQMLATLFKINASRDTEAQGRALEGGKRYYRGHTNTTDEDRAMDSVKALRADSDYAELVRVAFRWNQDVVDACDKMLEGLRTANHKMFLVTSPTNPLRPSMFFSATVQFMLWRTASPTQEMARIRMFTRQDEERIQAMEMASAESFGLEHARHPRVQGLCLQQSSLENYTVPLMPSEDSPKPLDTESAFTVNDLFGSDLDGGSEDLDVVPFRAEVDGPRPMHSDTEDGGEMDIGVQPETARTEKTLRRRADGTYALTLAEVERNIRELREKDKSEWPLSFDCTTRREDITPTITTFPCGALTERVDLTSTSPIEFLTRRFTRHDLGKEAFIRAMKDPQVTLKEAFAAIRKQQREMMAAAEDQFRDEEGVVDQNRLRDYLQQAGLVGEDTDGNEMIARMLEKAPEGGFNDIKRVLSAFYEKRMAECHLQYQMDQWGPTHMQAVDLIRRQAIQTLTDWAVEPDLMGDKRWLMSAAFRSAFQCIHERQGRQPKLVMPVTTSLSLGGSIMVADLGNARTAFGLDTGNTLRLYIAEQLIFLTAGYQHKRDVTAAIVADGAGKGKSYAARGALSTFPRGCSVHIQRATTTSMISESKSHSGVIRYHDELDPSYIGSGDNPATVERTNAWKAWLTGGVVSVETPGAKDAESGKRTAKQIEVEAMTSIVLNTNQALRLHNDLNTGELRPELSRMIFLFPNPLDRSMGSQRLTQMMHALEYLRDNGPQHPDYSLSCNLHRIKSYQDDQQYLHSLCYMYYMLSFIGVFRRCDIGNSLEVVAKLNMRVAQYKSARGGVAKMTEEPTHAMFMDSDADFERVVGQQTGNMQANDRQDQPFLAMVVACAMRRVMMTVLCTPEPTGLADPSCGKDCAHNERISGTEGLLRIFKMAERSMYVTTDDIAWSLSVIGDSFLPSITSNIMYAVRDMVISRDIIVDIDNQSSKNKRPGVTFTSTDMLTRKLKKLGTPVDVMLLGMMLEKITSFRYDGYPVLHITPARFNRGRRDDHDLAHGSYVFDLEAVLSGAFELGPAVIPALIEETSIGGRGRPDAVPVMYHPWLRTTVQPMGDNDNIRPEEKYMDIAHIHTADNTRVVVRVETLLPHPHRFVEIVRERTRRLALKIRNDPAHLKAMVSLMEDKMNIRTPLTSLVRAIEDFDTQPMVVYTEAAETPHSVMRRQGEVGVVVDDDECMAQVDDIVPSNVWDERTKEDVNLFLRTFDDRDQRHITFRTEPPDDTTMLRHHNAIHLDVGMRLSVANQTYDMQTAMVRDMICKGAIDERFVVALIGYVRQCNEERAFLRSKATEDAVRGSGVQLIKGAANLDVTQPPFDGAFNGYGSQMMQQRYESEHSDPDDPLYKTVYPERFERIFEPGLTDIFTFVGSSPDDPLVRAAFESGREFLSTIYIDAHGVSVCPHETDRVRERRRLRQAPLPLRHLPDVSYLQEGVYFIWDTPEVRQILSDMSMLVHMATLKVRSDTLVDVYFEGNDVLEMANDDHLDAVRQLDSDPTMIFLRTIHARWFTEVPYDQTRAEHRRRLEASSHQRMLSQATNGTNAGRAAQELACHMLNIRREEYEGRDRRWVSMMNAPRLAGMQVAQLALDRVDTSRAAITRDVQSQGDYESQHENQVMVEAVMGLPGVGPTQRTREFPAHLRAAMDNDEDMRQRLREEQRAGTIMRGMVFGHAQQVIRGQGAQTMGSSLLNMILQQTDESLYRQASQQFCQG